MIGFSLVARIQRLRKSAGRSNLVFSISISVASSKRRTSEEWSKSSLILLATFSRKSASVVVSGYTFWKNSSFISANTWSSIFSIVKVTSMSRSCTTSCGFSSACISIWGSLKSPLVERLSWSPTFLPLSASKAFSPNCLAAKVKNLSTCSASLKKVPEIWLFSLILSLTS